MKFKTIQSQIIVTFVTLIIGIQLTGLIPIEHSINENALRSAESDLKVGEGVFRNILEQNTANLKQGAKILASDYGFRESVASNDSETIISALNNHQARINADIAIFHSIYTSSTIISGGVSQPDATEVVDKLMADYKEDGNSLDFEIFNDVPYQLVAVPVKAPLVIGWVVMGFKIDDTLANKLQQLSNLQVTFIQKTKSNQWSVSASTLNSKQADILVSSVKQNNSHRTKKFEIKIDDELYDSTSIVLHEDDNLVLTVLQQSLTQATANYQQLKVNLFILVVIGLIIFILVTIYISKYLSAPIKALSDTAKEFEVGNYDVEVLTNRSDEIGTLSQSFIAMRDAIVMREKKVSRLAYWDETTGLLNRVAFMKQVSEEVEKAAKAETALAVIVFNIDRFKKINKILGRAFADKVLESVGKKLSDATRKTTDSIARIGADEFAVLLTDTDVKEVVEITEALLGIFDVALNIDEQNIDITMGVGISVYPDHGHSVEVLLHNAETALQVSKIKKAGIVLYDVNDDKDTEENLTLATELKTAISENQLALFLQPKVDITTKEVNSAEALIRWIHPQKGFIFPDQFIPFAEETGIIQKVTQWMLVEACKAHIDLKKKGIFLKIAINISTRDLIDQQLPTIIASLFKKYKIGVEAISLEITESSIMDDPIRSEQTLFRLSEMGLNISIDDYGTGYSSLAYLKKLPVQELKIDKSFVLKVDQNEHDATIVRSTIDLGHNLNLKVVAEGIETEASWTLLNSMGCDFGQGYLMAKPMNIQAFQAWYKDWQDINSKKIA